MVTGLSVPAVKTRSMRARLKLRKKLSFWFEKRSAVAAGRRVRSLIQFQGEAAPEAPIQIGGDE